MYSVVTVHMSLNINDAPPNQDKITIEFYTKGVCRANY